MSRMSRTSIAKALRIRPGTAGMAAIEAIVEIAAGAEDVGVAVAGVADAADGMEAVADGTAAGMVATAAADGIKTRANFFATDLRGFSRINHKEKGCDLASRPLLFSSRAGLPRHRPHGKVCRGKARNAHGLPGRAPEQPHSSYGVRCRPEV